MLMAGSGLVLIYAGVKGEDLRELLVSTFTAKRGSTSSGPAAKKKPATVPAAPVGSGGGGGGGGSTDTVQHPGGTGGAW